MNQPNVTAIPGILLRTILRTLARILFLLAAVLLAGGLAVTFLAFLLCTFRTARPRRVQAAVNLATALAEFARSLK